LNLGLTYGDRGERAYITMVWGPKPHGHLAKPVVSGLRAYFVVHAVFLNTSLYFDASDVGRPICLLLFTSVLHVYLQNGSKRSHSVLSSTWLTRTTEPIYVIPRHTSC